MKVLKFLTKLNKDEYNIIIPSDNIKFNTELVLSNSLLESYIYKSIFDQCYKQDWFEKLDYLIKICIAIKTTFQIIFSFSFNKSNHLQINSS